VECGGWREARLREQGQYKLQKETTMNGTVMQAILWILAGFFLTLLIIRRGKRKAQSNK